MDNDTDSLPLIELAFNNYIAARYLLKNKFVLQGVTLATASVVKYLSAILIYERKYICMSLYDFERLKYSLNSRKTDFTTKIDENFFEILGKVHERQSYSNPNFLITIGFFVNQFLCELDYSINYFENVFSENNIDKNGNEVSSSYQKYASENNSALVLNNYLFNRLSKKEFMEQPDNGYFINTASNKWDGNFLIEKQNVLNKYDGKIALIAENFQLV